MSVPLSEIFVEVSVSGKGGGVGANNQLPW
jgi:hypothetical protein